MNNTLMLVLLLISNTALLADDKTICGHDDRQNSFDQKIARVRDRLAGSNACTATLISRSCMISAGHCVSYLKYVEFNVPNSSEEGVMNFPTSDYIYKVDPSSIRTQSYYIGQDWSVFKLLPHEKNNTYAGDVFGFYEIDFEIPFKTKEIRITGYGTSSIKPLNYVQKTDMGPVTALEANIVKYEVDSTGGNSGSAIIDNDTKKIIGVHTNGACQFNYGSNFGTLISGNQKFKDAVIKCLASEDH